MFSHFMHRRWLDFRNGHGIYLAFTMAFANFLLLSYNFAIKQVSFLNELFSNLTTFALVFVAIYIPTAMALGYWHRRKQYVVENEAWIQENWIAAWIWRYQNRLIQGKTSSEEDAHVKIFLENILKRHKKDSILEFGSNSSSKEPKEE